MSGTVSGGLAAAAKNKQLYGMNFYRVIGAAGGKVKVPKGFAKNKALARLAGKIGGERSTR